jgi:hypothetical protein
MKMMNMSLKNFGEERNKMKLRNILRLIAGSQLVTIIDDDRIVLESWEAIDAWNYLELEIKKEYLEYDVIRLETSQDALQIRILKY